MKVLFLSLIDFDSFSDRNIYTDLLREFMKRGHEVVAISPFERKTNKEEKIIDEGLGKILKVKIGNTQKVNFLEKGISTVMLEGQILNVAKKKLKDIKFALVLYTTPPITFRKVIEYFKKRDSATTYLLLKDIFPQNAVDLEILSKKGVKGILHSYFRKKECDLYKISDFIGCMSQANVDYLRAHNTFLDGERIEVCPNSIEVREIDNNMNREAMREKYQLPLGKTIFVYGGNLGKPQGIQDYLKCVENCSVLQAFFLIIGTGTEYVWLEKTISEKRLDNVMLKRGVPHNEYDALLTCCDVGVICLDKRFTIPNFPSRLLAYMQAKLPILALTDSNTDIGRIAEQNKFGYWCVNGQNEKFNALCKLLCDDVEQRKLLGDNSKKYLMQNYTTEIATSIILNRVGR